MPRLLALALLAPLAACAGDPVAASPDAAGQADAAAPSNCTAAAELGDLGALTGTPMASGAAATRVVAVSMTVASDGATRDALFVQLKGGKGPFTGAPAPGTYPLTDSDYATCGTCVTLIGDIRAGVGPTQFYLATGGTLTIASADGRLTGTATDLSLRELDIGTSMLVKGGCTSHVGAVSFDVALP